MQQNFHIAKYITAVFTIHFHSMLLWWGSLLNKVCLSPMCSGHNCKYQCLQKQGSQYSREIKFKDFSRTFKESRH